MCACNHTRARRRRVAVGDADGERREILTDIARRGRGDGPDATCAPVTATGRHRAPPPRTGARRGDSSV